MVRLKITVVIDNKSSGELVSEHGLCLWVETPSVKILFDTGKGDAFLPNIEALGIPLEQANYVVLSHGHYDHAGALAEALEVASQAKLIIHPNAKVSRYRLREGLVAKDVGMPARALAAVEGLPSERILWSNKIIKIDEQIGVTGPISRQTSFENTGGAFFLDTEGLEADTLPDDQALWIETSEGLVVCVGCAHSGLINTLRHVQTVSGIRKLRAVIGGFHLHNASPERLQQTIAELNIFTPKQLFPCHCTGESATKELKQALGEDVVKDIHTTGLALDV